MTRLTSRFLKRTVTAVAIIMGLWLVLSFLLELNESKSSYQTLLAAKQDQIFERGWLPDILPPSTERIVTRNNLDLNTSSGEFYFKPEHWEGFQRYLTSDNKNPTRWHFKEHASVWTFDCDLTKGYCRYALSLDRPV